MGRLSDRFASPNVSPPSSYFAALDASKMQHRASKNTEDRERRIVRCRALGALALAFQCLEDWAWVCKLTSMTKYLTTYATVLALSLCAPWVSARAQSAPCQHQQENTR